LPGLFYLDILTGADMATETEDTLHLLKKACVQLRKWSREGKTIEGYAYGRGPEYLGQLLNLPYNYREDAGRFLRAYKSSGSRLLENMTGPNGWAYFQAYLIKRGLKNNA